MSPLVAEMMDLPFRETLRGSRKDLRYAAGTAMRTVSELSATALMSADTSMNLVLSSSSDRYLGLIPSERTVSRMSRFRICHITLFPLPVSRPTRAVAQLP